jgi:alcohol dehydrogenase, propanol-preferring
MKAMVLRKKNEPFVLEERPDPKAGPGEAVARVIACGSGLTIHHARAGRVAINYPIIIGHEVLGEIVETGPGVKGFKSGDIVTLHCYLSCGHCRWCRVNREPSVRQPPWLCRPPRRRRLRRVHQAPRPKFHPCARRD